MDFAAQTAPGAAVGTRRLTALALVGTLVAAGCGADAGGGEGPSDPVLTPQSAREAREAAEGTRSTTERSNAKVVELRGAGPTKTERADPTDDAPSPGAQSDAEVRAELREARAALRDFRGYLTTTAYLPTGPRARVAHDGTAVAPEDAPEVVKRVILAANQIAKFPYRWGGGHGAWRDNGYDCSGSVSFALAGAGLLSRPLTSGDFLGYGAEGAGRWITIYTNPGHIFMVVAGLRFDTSGRGRAGTRWQEAPRSTAGFAVRHVPGL
jgi:cell wall-associated NlpC family hydrolase